MKKVDIARFDPTGAGDPSGSIFGLPFSAEEANVVLVPVPWEVTTSYRRGTARGPEAIRAASIQLDLFDPTLAPFGMSAPWEYGIHMLASDPTVEQLNREACEWSTPIIDAGGVSSDDGELGPLLTKVNRHCAQLDAWVHGRVMELLRAGKIVGVIGGDHSVAFGSIRAHAECYPAMGVLHVDAHADLRHAYEGFERSHASVLRNVVDQIPDLASLVQIGLRDFSREEFEYGSAHPKISMWCDMALRERLAGGTSWSTLWNEILAPLPSDVYITFDIDGLDPSLCPSTGTPVPGGLSYVEACQILLAVLRSGRRVVGFDLVEVAPSDRSGDQWDGNVGARIVYKLCGLALAGALPGAPG